MKNKNKFLTKILSLLTLVVMGFGAMSFSKSNAVKVYAETGGSCGSGVTWKLENGDTLRISGSGAMEDYDDYDETPWYIAEVYYDSENITKIVIDDGVTKIGKYAFAYFYYVNEIQIGNNVKSIGDYAFSEVGSKQRTTIKLQFPSALKNFGNYSFYYANIGGQLKFPTYTERIGDYAFSETNITSVYVAEPNNNDSFWGEYSFYYCPKLIDVTFENGVTKVGYGAFYKCYALQCIEFPETIQRLEHAAFGYDSSIDKIFYKGTNFLSNITWDTYNDYITKDRTKHYTLYENWVPKYVDKDGKTVDCNNRKMYNIVTQDCELTDGYWVVRSSNLSLGGTSLEVSGNVTLVLLDNSGITTSGGIHVHPDKTLIIASEHVDASDNKMGYIKVSSTPRLQAGLGGKSDENNINIVICGGDIESHGEYYGAGIGSGSNGSATVTIYNGNIKAYGGTCGAGIGGGWDSNSTVTINNGTIKAYAGSQGGAIGGGTLGNATITINNGNIESYGNYSGTGIGGGYNVDATVTINNGDIKSYGGHDGAGIGSGSYGNAIVTINNGNIEAYGGTYGAGIGSGTSGNATVNLYSGNIFAKGGIDAKDIGAGCYADATVNDYRPGENNGTGTLLSNGSVVIVSVVGAIALITCGVFVVLYIREKKKKGSIN